MTRFSLSIPSELTLLPLSLGPLASFFASILSLRFLLSVVLHLPMLLLFFSNEPPIWIAYDPEAWPVLIDDFVEHVYWIPESHYDYSNFHCSYGDTESQSCVLEDPLPGLRSIYVHKKKLPEETTNNDMEHSNASDDLISSNCKRSRDHGAVDWEDMIHEGTHQRTAWKLVGKVAPCVHPSPNVQLKVVFQRGLQDYSQLGPLCSLVERGWLPLDEGFVMVKLLSLCLKGIMIKKECI
ncbi:uncharacterized protein LOC130741053 isoform X2 [Lotus japonicus]|uniref:uncharacterized protein LOC130741053 isoform X2 n=1 Tax=Lotus japonicus TaxID=34305 RepID=UPI00258A28AD|nr:uncharacterized protein LOC130741053 isoform X2 [Lotus japonicus]